jgi:hypothetical protein
MTAAWTDKNCSELELQAALSFWRKYHSIGARRRVRAAIAYFRQYH